MKSVEFNRKLHTILLKFIFKMAYFTENDCCLSYRRELIGCRLAHFRVPYSYISTFVFKKIS